jgi:hypothetical protein
MLPSSQACTLTRRASRLSFCRWLALVNGPVPGRRQIAGRVLLSGGLATLALRSTSRLGAEELSTKARRNVEQCTDAQLHRRYGPAPWMRRSTRAVK